MKKLLIALNIAIWSLVCFEFAHAEAVVKQVCEDKKDSKGKVIKKADGSATQVCKTIKTHKKVEGDKVPDGKKK